ncbi:MAG TPA: hypothetical protein VMB80_18220 [Candidatus Acidoferrum sp.]|nr:hypothetical protein [Candidatus Acidoferrum sp.]
MTLRKPAAELEGRRGVIRLFGLLLSATVLAGCRSGNLAYYISPQVTGRVLAADTRQPLEGATVRRVVPTPSDGEATPPKGGQLMMQPGAVYTDADGRFVLDAVRDLTLFQHSGWHSVTVAFAGAGYGSWQTNFTAADYKARTPEGVPRVNAGDILLQPQPK